LVSGLRRNSALVQSLVIGEKPRFGAVLSGGSKVNLVVSLGKKPKKKR
jgi:beta-lactam-binding protein with PASTA domain